MALVMPTRTDVPHHDFQVDLDGVTYTLELRWNTRAEAWFLSVQDAQGEEIVGGLRVVLDWPLTARYRLEGLPAGDFVATDTTASQVEAGIDELGGRVLLVYFPPDELPAAFRR